MMMGIFLLRELGNIVTLSVSTMLCWQYREMLLGSMICLKDNLTKLYIDLPIYVLFINQPSNLHVNALQNPVQQNQVIRSFSSTF
jgi:hypothetical protein